MFNDLSSTESGAENANSPVEQHSAPLIASLPHEGAAGPGAGFHRVSFSLPPKSSLRKKGGMKRALLMAVVVLVGSSRAVPLTLEHTVDKVVRTMALQSKIIAEFTKMTTELRGLRSDPVDSVVDPHVDNILAMSKQLQRVAEEK